MRKVIITILCVAVTYVASAQNKTENSLDYKTGIGLRIFNGGGITLKTFFAPNQAAEVIAFFYEDGTRLTGLYELHGPLSTEGNLKYYFGFGGGVRLQKNVTAIHLGGVAGLDYKFKNMPVNASLDWQPMVELGSGANNGFKGNWFGLSVRYTL